MALSDPQSILASPFTIVDRSDDATAIAAITGIIEQYEIAHIVVGLPYSMNGSLGVQAEKVKEFMRKLSGHTKGQVEFRDERLTTVLAKRLMKSAKTKKNSRDDAIAAAIILQGYLDEARYTEKIHGDN